MQEFICQSVHHVMLNNSIAIARNFMFMISTFSHPPMASVAKVNLFVRFSGRKDPRADRCVVNFTEKVQTKKKLRLLTPGQFKIARQRLVSQARSPCKQEGKSDRWAGQKWRLNRNNRTNLKQSQGQTQARRVSWTNPISRASDVKVSIRMGSLRPLCSGGDRQPQI